jgi:charged multivesicular body protein 2A
MAEAMRGVTKAMKSMNKRINLPGIQKIMMDFEKESEMMDMKEEMMNDTIDDAVCRPAYLALNLIRID